MLLQIICFFISETMTKLEFSRLPTSIVPSNYKLHLIPDLVNFTFKYGMINKLITFNIRLS